MAAALQSATPHSEARPGPTQPARSEARPGPADAGSHTPSTTRRGWRGPTLRLEQRPRPASALSPWMLAGGLIVLSLIVLLTLAGVALILVR